MSEPAFDPLGCCVTLFIWSVLFLLVLIVLGLGWNVLEWLWTWVRWAWR